MAWVFALVVAFALCGAVAEAQQQAKMAKIGFLTAGSTPEQLGVNSSGEISVHSVTSRART